MKKPMSDAQNQRQDHRENGKYAKVNPCYGCGKSAGLHYASHPLTDTGNWDDAAICLCMKCWEATKNMTKVEDFIEFSEKNGGGS